MIYFGQQCYYSHVSQFKAVCQPVIANIVIGVHPSFVPPGQLETYSFQAVLGLPQSLLNTSSNSSCEGATGLL